MSEANLSEGLPASIDQRWRWKFHPEVSGGGGGLYYGDVLVAEIYPSIRPGAWCWAVWIGEIEGGVVSNASEATAEIERAIARRDPESFEIGT